MLVQNLDQLSSVLSLVISATTNDLLDELKSIVNETVYANEPEWYERTNQFKNAWEKDATKIIGNIVEDRIFPNNNLDWNADLFQHGNIYAPIDNDDYGNNGLYTILDNGANNANNPFGFPQTPAHNYWDKFLDYVDHNLDKIFIKHCRYFGLDVKATIGAW